MSLYLDLIFFEFSFKVDKSSTNKIYAFEDFRFDAGHLMLSSQGCEIALAPKAAETLLAFIENRGEILSKEELMNVIWGDSSVEESNLAQYLHVLRKTLGSQKDGRPFIETLHRRGYRFSAQVVVFKSPNGNGAGVPVAEPGIDRRRDVPVYNSAAAGHRPHERPIVLIVLATLLVSLGLAFGMYRFAVSDKPVRPDTAAMPFQEANVVRVTTAGRTKRAAISPDGRYIAHVTEDQEGSGLWVRQVAGTTDVRIAGPSKSEFVWAAFAPDSNSVYYLSLDRDKGDTELFRVPLLGGPAVKAANDTGPVGFSPDGASMVFIRGDKEKTRLIISDIDGTNWREIAMRQQPEFFRINWNAPAWSPDGRTIACPARLSDEVGQFDTVLAFDAADGSERRFTDKRWGEVGQPQWLADGLLLTATERSNGPQQIWHISSDGSATRVTHDFNDYFDLSVTSDGSRLAAVQVHVVSAIWVTRNDNARDSREIASEVGALDDLAWMGDTRIAYVSNAGGGSDIWVTDADGTNARQITTGALAGNGIAVSPAGEQIYFSSERAGRSNIWRVDTDGTNLRKLTNGDGEFHPACTPDGQWVVFQQGGVDTSLWKIPSGGGEAVRVYDQRASRPSISPDGSLIAFHYLDPDLERSRWCIGVVPAAGGNRTKRFELPPTINRRLVRWNKDGSAIAFINRTGGDSDIWLQPLDGGRQRQLTNFKASNIQAFQWSPNGTSLAVIRSAETSDVVLMNKTAP